MTLLTDTIAKLEALLTAPLVTCGAVTDEPESWIEGDTLYAHDRESVAGGYTAVLVAYAEEDWADRITGHGATRAKAQMDMFDKLAEWNS